MKTVRVVAAVILDHNRIFATQRGYGNYKDGWEFPGGKIEPGETPSQAIVREIDEELGILIQPLRFIKTVEYDYSDFHLSMDCFLCRIIGGNPVLREHEASKWLTRSELDSVEWLPADMDLVNTIKSSSVL